MTVVANSPAAWSARAGAPTAWEAALWSERGQQARFDAVLRHLRLEPADSLLDFGCGAGALCERLPRYVSYNAYDWAPAMRARCRVDHLDARVYEVEPAGVEFDHVVAIGTFNLRDGWWKERTWETLERLWTMARKTLAVSLYRGDDPACLSYSELDAQVFAHRLVDVRRILIDTTYLENDLLLVVRR